MPVMFKCGDESRPYTVEYRDESLFVLVDGCDPIEVGTPLELDASFDLDEFDVYLLDSPDIRENDVRQVFNKIVGDKARIGWAIPVLSLVSDQHDFAADEHFLKYSYVALAKSLSALPKDIILDVSDLRCIEPLKMFGEGAVVLVVSRLTLRNGHDFELRRALPSLVSYGYSPRSIEDDRSYPWVMRDPIAKSIAIVQSARTPDDHDMVAAMLNGFVSSQRSVALQFFYLYQIIELLMERVVAFRQVEIADSIARAGSNSSLIKAALEKIGEINSEKSRMNLVVDRYARMGAELGDLRAQCNRLKIKLGMDTGESMSEYLYPLRNYIFHNFRSFPKDAEAELKSVVSSLLAVMPLFLARFEAP